jgi:hypothetical protein
MLFLGEMLIGIDLEGEEPGDDSKCIVYVCLRVLNVCVCVGGWMGYMGR